MERWSSKKVRELLVMLSRNERAFPVSESKIKVKGHHGYKYSTRGYFFIDGAYGGVKLEYVLPYSTGVDNVTHGHIPSGELAKILNALGSDGLKGKYVALEKYWKPIMKREFEAEKKRQ